MAAEDNKDVSITISSEEENERDQSSLSTSSEEPSSEESSEDESDSDEEQRPDSHSVQPAAVDENHEPVDLRSRLETFLPQLAKANDDLTTEQRLDDAAEDEPHIEMNLGLGGLEEQQGDDIKFHGSDSNSESTEDAALPSISQAEEPPAKKRKIQVVD